MLSLDNMINWEPLGKLRLLLAEYICAIIIKELVVKRELVWAGIWHVGRACFISWFLCTHTSRESTEASWVGKIVFVFSWICYKNIYKLAWELEYPALHGFKTYSLKANLLNLLKINVALNLVRIRLQLYKIDTWNLSHNRDTYRVSRSYVLMKYDPAMTPKTE